MHVLGKVHDGVGLDLSCHAFPRALGCSILDCWVSAAAARYFLVQDEISGALVIIETRCIDISVQLNIIATSIAGESDIITPRLGVVMNIFSENNVLNLS